LQPSSGSVTVTKRDELRQREGFSFTIEIQIYYFVTMPNNGIIKSISNKVVKINRLQCTGNV
jgi:hypothetical protein